VAHNHAPFLAGRVSLAGPLARVRILARIETDGPRPHATGSIWWTSNANPFPNDRNFVRFPVAPGREPTEIVIELPRRRFGPGDTMHQLHLSPMDSLGTFTLLSLTVE
jgi:hypothetical protein